jgi:hypothetical protein
MQVAQTVRPARPQRVKSRVGTNRTSCGPFALEWILANERTPTVLPTSEALLFPVEGLSDAGTLLADFPSSLLSFAQWTTSLLGRPGLFHRH